MSTEPAPQPESDPAGARDPAGDGSDVSGRDRIRAAAIVEFAERGVAATSLKVIAQRAHVSQALIVHHFGSKDELREACDAHVAAVIRHYKLKAMRQGTALDPIAALRDFDEYRPLLRYLARTLGDGRPQVAKLVDEMIDDAVEYMAEAERSGLVKPSQHPRERAAILVLWSLGLLTLHDHVERQLGVDLLSASTPDLGAYMLPTMEMLSQGVLVDDMYDQLRSALDQMANQQTASFSGE